MDRFLSSLFLTACLWGITNLSGMSSPTHIIDQAGNSSFPNLVFLNLSN